MARSLLLLSLLFSLSYAITVTINGCACNEVIKESECDSYYGRACEWNVEKAICEDPTPIDCPFLTQYGSDRCHRQFECAWYKNNCIDFKDCSDFTESVDDKCNYINANCATLDNGKCGKEKLPECQTQSVDSCTYDSDGICVLYGTPAACVKFDSCEKGSNSIDYCNKNKLACVWVQNKCQAKTCVDVTAQSQCKYVFEYGAKKATLCHWVDNKCVDGEDDHYTEENCFTESAYGKVWKDGDCRSCNFGGMFSALIVILAMVL